MRSSRSIGRQPSLRSKEEDFGGFPYPHVILLRLLRKFFSRFQQRLERTVTLPHTPAVQSQRGGQVRDVVSGFASCDLSLVPYLQTTVLGATRVPYISFDAIVGRNSKFHGLTSENLEELGGIEYRALNMLLWIIGLVSAR
jgi:Trk/Ktr/HKT type cation transporter